MHSKRSSAENREQVMEDEVPPAIPNNTNQKLDVTSTVGALEVTLLEAQRLIKRLNDAGITASSPEMKSFDMQQLSPQAKSLSVSDLNEWIQHYEAVVTDLKVVKHERNQAREALCSIHKEVDNLKQNIFKLKKQVNDQFELIAEEIKSLESTALQHSGKPSKHDSQTSNEHKASQSKDSRHKNHTKGKVFHARDSRLSELLLIKDFRTVYNIFVALLMLLGASVLWQNSFEEQSIVDFSTFYYAFGQIDYALIVWCGLFAFSCLSFGWKYLIPVLPFNLLLSVYALIQCTFMIAAGYACLSRELPPASGLIVMIEATRLAMKIHSFFRTLLDHSMTVISKKKDDDDPERTYEAYTFGSFFYFLFVPTIIYRVSYPRTPYTNWGVVIARLSEVSMVVLFTYVMLAKFGLPHIKKSAESPDSLSQFVLSIFNSMMPGMMIFVFCFFGLLHSWLNAWAEITRFADRSFYKDWWNADSFGTFYRSWNLPVHDWLYTYVYSDTVEFFKSRKYSAGAAKNLAALLVIEFSALVHEYIIACAIGYWFPLLLFMFGGPGVLFTHMNKERHQAHRYNVFFWSMMLIGHGLLLSMYLREYYSRQPYAVQKDVFTLDYWRQFFTPYSIVMQWR